LVYHHIPDDQICEFDFSQDQLTVRKYYFNFSPSAGLRIEHKPKGTLITVAKKDYDRRLLYSMVEICPTEKQPVRFHVQTSYDDFKIEARYKSFCNDCSIRVPVNERSRGCIMLKDNNLITTVGRYNSHSCLVRKDVCLLCINVDDTYKMGRF